MSDPNHDENQRFKDQAKLLLTYYTSQVPAHATYIVTGMFTVLSTVTGLAIAIIQFRNMVLDLVIFALIGISFYFVSYSFARLLYYNESIYILYDSLGLSTETRERYYQRFFQIANASLPSSGMANLVQCEFFYRIDHEKRVKPSNLVRMKFYLLKAFYRQRRYEIWRKQVEKLIEIHKSLDAQP